MRLPAGLCVLKYLSTILMECVSQPPSNTFFICSYSALKSGFLAVVNMAPMATWCPTSLRACRPHTDLKRSSAAGERRKMWSVSMYTPPYSCSIWKRRKSLRCAGFATLKPLSLAGTSLAKKGITSTSGIAFTAVHQPLHGSTLSRMCTMIFVGLRWICAALMATQHVQSKARVPWSDSTTCTMRGTCSAAAGLGEVGMSHFCPRQLYVSAVVILIDTGSQPPPKPQSVSSCGTFTSFVCGQ